MVAKLKNPKRGTHGPAQQAPLWPADKVERRPLAKLLPYARNARTHSDAQIAAIAASIKEWGWTMPLLVDESGGLIAGHGRVLAAHLLRLTEAPVMVARGWSPAQIRSYRIADNKLALLSGWDEELLGLELADLREFGANLELTGFEAADIDKLIAGPQAPDGFTPYDESITTEHQCPKCGFKWSGTATARREAAE